MSASILFINFLIIKLWNVYLIWNYIHYKQHIVKYLLILYNHLLEVLIKSHKHILLTYFTNSTLIYFISYSL